MMTMDPSQLHIVSYPATVLRKRAEPVNEVTDEVRAVALRMMELMREAEGIGLAAPQVGLPWRLFVAHVPPFEDDGRSLDDDPATATAEPVVYINPVLKDFSRDLEPYEEGCLSLAGIVGDVRRPTTVTIEALDLDAQPFAQRGVGLLSRCWQHEFDHLDGVLIIDKFDPAARLRNRKAIKALEEGASRL
jgi:peptide deformylase